jgi:hypothetical protein
MDDTANLIPGYSWSFAAKNASGILTTEDTSLFSGTVKERCNGNFPLPYDHDNIQGITGGNDYVSIIKKVRAGSFTTTMTGNKPFRLEKEFSASTHGSCNTLQVAIFPIGLFILDDKGAVFKAGLS